MKLQPQNIEAEQNVLGGVLLAQDAIPKCIEAGLTPEHFYNENNGKIWAAILKMFDEGSPVDPVTLAEALTVSKCLHRVGGAAYISELLDGVGTAANVEHYARLVIAKSIQRRLIRASGEIAEKSYFATSDVGELLDEAEAKILAVRSGHFRGNGFLHIAGEPLHWTLAGIEQRSVAGRAIAGYSTGLPDIDRALAGFHKGDLTILAGRPSMGKTALAINIAKGIALREGLGVAFFSLEMSLEQLHHRLVADLAGVHLTNIRTGQDLTEGDWSSIAEAAGRLGALPFYVDDTPAQTVLDIRAKARRLKSRLQAEGVGFGLVVVDYLQLMRGSGKENREQEISEISRSLKALAKELEAPVLALSQLNRRVDERTDKRPMLSDLRESGAIEQDADNVLFVFRPYPYTRNEADLRRALLIVAKQRQGPVFDVSLQFWGEYSRFICITEDY